MRPDREKPTVLLPAAVALAIHVLAKRDYVLPPLALAAMIASYWVAGPRRRLGPGALLAAAAVLFGPAYLYQRAFMSEGFSLYIFPAWAVNASAALAVVFLAVLPYGPPGGGRRWGAPFLSFVLVALSGNDRAPTLYLEGTALYFLALMIHLQRLERRDRIRAAAPAGRWVAPAANLLFYALVAGLSASFVVTLRGSEERMISFAVEWQRIFGSRERLRIGGTMDSSFPSSLAGSDQIVLELEGQGPMPSYLRLQVFTDYDFAQGDWKEDKSEAAAEAPAPDRQGTTPIYRVAAGPPPEWGYTIDFRVDLEGSSRLPAPVGTEQVVSAVAVGQAPDTGLIQVAGPLKPKGYRLAGAGLGLPPPSPEVLAQALEVPPPLRTAIQAKADAITAGAASNLDKARAVADHFESGYLYSIEGPVRRGDNIVRFLAGDTATGFCQNFAESAAMLLRAAGAPARVVGGFMLREEDEDPSGYYLVKGRDAHAWIEVYDEAAGGWRAFDPTPAGAMDQALGLNGWYERFLARPVDFLRTRLRDLVQFLKEMTLPDVVGLIARPGVIAAAGAVLLLGFALRMARGKGTIRARRPQLERAGGRKPAPPAGRLAAGYLAFIKLLSERGVEVRESDCGSEVIERLRTAAAAPRDFFKLGAELIDVYDSWRFKAKTAEDETREAERIDAILARLRTSPPPAPKQEGPSP